MKGLRVCSKCGLMLPLAAFHRHSGGGWQAACRYCTRATFKDWYVDNYERFYAGIRAWQHRNPDSVRASKTRWREANRQQQRQAVARWRKENPDKVKQYVDSRRARIYGVDSEPIDYEALLAECGMVCHICERPIASRSDLHWDHVIPLSRGGTHTADNLRPSHALCNLRKADKLQIKT